MIVEVILLVLLLLIIDDDDKVDNEDTDVVGGNNISVVNDNFAEDDKITGDDANEGVNDGR